MNAKLEIPRGVPDWAWAKVATPAGDHWEIRERNALGEVIGTAYRLQDGGKGFEKGGKRGLILPWPLNTYAGTTTLDPVFIAEGASDTAALLGLGLDAVGLPMAGQCGTMLAELLTARHVVIVADADVAGRTGAAKIAALLVASCASVRIIAAPEDAKDAREAVIAGADRITFLGLAAQSAPMSGSTPCPTPGPVIVRLADVVPQPVKWLWVGRIALGKLTLIAGDPGLGKSFLTLDIAARVSRGLAWPDSGNVAHEPAGVVLLSAEDDAADTIRPRLDAAGADVHRVIALQAVPTMGDNGQPAGTRMFDLSRDLDMLERAIFECPNCRLVVIDPLTAYLGANADSHKNADIRSLLAPLATLAAKHGVALVAVTHLNKNSAGAAIYRTMGSLAFTAAARAAWVVTKDKENLHRRLFLPIKNNIAQDSGGLAYSIEVVPGHVQPALAWESEPVCISADDALDSTPKDKAGGALEEAMDWLRDALVDGPRPAADIKAMAASEGIKARTLDRAKKELAVIASREGYSEKGRWVWHMPHSAPAKPIERQPRVLALNGTHGAQWNGRLD